MKSKFILIYFFILISIIRPSDAQKSKNSIKFEVKSPLIQLVVHDEFDLYDTTAFDQTSDIVVRLDDVGRTYRIQLDGTNGTCARITGTTTVMCKSNHEETCNIAVAEITMNSWVSVAYKTINPLIASTTYGHRIMQLNPWKQSGCFFFPNSSSGGDTSLAKPKPPKILWNNSVAYLPTLISPSSRVRVWGVKDTENKFALGTFGWTDVTDDGSGGGILKCTALKVCKDTLAVIDWNPMSFTPPEFAENGAASNEFNWYWIEDKSATFVKFNPGMCAATTVTCSITNRILGDEVVTSICKTTMATHKPSKTASCMWSIPKGVFLNITTSNDEEEASSSSSTSKTYKLKVVAPPSYPDTMTIGSLDLSKCGANGLYCMNDTEALTTTYISVGRSAIALHANNVSISAVLVFPNKDLIVTESRPAVLMQHYVNAYQSAPSLVGCVDFVLADIDRSAETTPRCPNALQDILEIGISTPNVAERYALKYRTFAHKCNKEAGGSLTASSTLDTSEYVARLVASAKYSDVSVYASGSGAVQALAFMVAAAANNITVKAVLLDNPPASPLRSVAEECIDSAAALRNTIAVLSRWCANNTLCATDLHRNTTLAEHAEHMLRPGAWPQKVSLRWHNPETGTASTETLVLHRSHVEAVIREMAVAASAMPSAFGCLARAILEMDINGNPTALARYYVHMRDRETAVRHMDRAADRIFRMKAMPYGCHSTVQRIKNVYNGVGREVLAAPYGLAPLATSALDAAFGSNCAAMYTQEAQNETRTPVPWTVQCPVVVVSAEANPLDMSPSEPLSYAPNATHIKVMSSIGPATTTMESHSIIATAFHTLMTGDAYETPEETVMESPYAMLFKYFPIGQPDNVLESYAYNAMGSVEFMYGIGDVMACPLSGNITKVAPSSTYIHGAIQFNDCEYVENQIISGITSEDSNQLMSYNFNVIRRIPATNGASDSDSLSS